MLRFKQKTRRDLVVSLLPPISITKTNESSLKQRLYSDFPPPITYTGSFPPKVLRHLDKSTFYSTPTKGESLLAKKAIHDIEDTSKQKSSERPTSRLIMDKERKVDNTKKNKKIRIKPKNVNNTVKIPEKEIRCVSAPGFREESRKQVLETGNLTAPTTPRLNTPGRSRKIGTPTQASSLGRVNCPEQEKEVVLELRGDSIDRFSHASSRPNSRISTTSRLDWQMKMSEQHQCICAAKPKLRSAIREVPCAQKRIENAPKGTAKFEIRAVGFSLTVYDKKNSEFLRMNERRNQLLKDCTIVKDKTIQTPRVDGEDTKTFNLPIVMEKHDQEIELTCAKEIASVDDKIRKKSNENKKDESSMEAKLGENLKSFVEISENDNNENRNEVNEPKMDNVSDFTKYPKKKKFTQQKKRGRRNSKIKGPKK